MFVNLLKIFEIFIKCLKIFWKCLKIFWKCLKFFKNKHFIYISNIFKNLQTFFKNFQTLIRLHSLKKYYGKEQISAVSKIQNTKYCLRFGHIWLDFLARNNSTKYSGIFFEVMMLQALGNDVISKLIILKLIKKLTRKRSDLWLMIFFTFGWWFFWCFDVEVLWIHSLSPIAQ